MHRFRPLAGIMVLIEASSMTNKEKELLVSVPLRGLWFLSTEVYDDIFPGIEVSVPLRGLWFLSTAGKHQLEHRPRNVSVPLRGLWFLSDGIAINCFCCHSFRPLAGIMVLIT